MAYSPKNVPGNPAALPDFLRAELQRLAFELQTANPLLRVALTEVTPDKPRRGDVRYADGTNWSPGAEGFYWFDGTTWQPFGGGTSQYDVGCFIGGVPGASERVSSFVVVRAFDLPASFTGSQGKASTAATAQTDFDVQKNSSSVGTVRFAAAATTATFIAASAVSFAVGDRLSVIAPGTPDATLADISITFKGVPT